MKLTTWGTVPEWCRKFRIRPDWILGWVLWTSLEPYPGKKYSSRDWDADAIQDDVSVQGLKIFHARPGVFGSIPAKPGQVYAYGMSGRDVYWIPGATRPKFGVYVSDEDDLRFFTDLVDEGWDHGD